MIAAAALSGAFAGTSEAQGELDVFPIGECIVVDHTGVPVGAWWGYDNLGAERTLVPGSTDNFFSPPPVLRGQPTTIVPGRRRNVVYVPLSGSARITWILLGRTATLDSQTSPRCAQAEPPIPRVVTAPPEAVGPTTATLVGVVDPNTATGAEMWFRHGAPGLAPASETPRVALPAGREPAIVRAPLTGLTPSTGYEVQAVATSAAGPAAGLTLPFTTLAPPIPEPDPVDPEPPAPPADPVTVTVPVPVPVLAPPSPRVPSPPAPPTQLVLAAAPARDVAPPFRWAVNGRVGAAASCPATEARLVLRRGRSTVARTSAPVGAMCRFSAVLAPKASRLARAGSLTVTVSVPGAEDARLTLRYGSARARR